MTAQADDERDFITLLRHLERAADGRPKIGRSLDAEQDIATLGQDPYSVFPKTNLVEVRSGEGGIPDLRVRFLGLFGPQGPLPLSTTMEVERWVNDGDRGFVEFADILTNRFLQLFFRAWSDARAIAQMDHPDRDRFQDFVASLGGFGSRTLQDHPVLSNLLRQDVVPLTLRRVRSARALEQMLGHVMDAEIEIEEFVPMRLAFEPEDMSRIGQQANALGLSTQLGQSVVSVNGRICVHVKARTVEEYFTYLPGRAAHAIVSSLVENFMGSAIDPVMAVALPRGVIPPIQLGGSGYLGWLAAVPSNDNAPHASGDADDWVEVGRFSLRPKTK